MSNNLEDMPLSVSLIVTCKNRLNHLKETLPTFLAQPFAKIIIVDYGCKQGTSEWINSLNLNLCVEKVDDDSFFCLARARNAALRHVNSDLILFTDADIKLRPDLGPWLREYVDLPETFFIAQRPCHNSLYGTMICKTQDFNRVGGYDEAYKSWGGEDTDLYTRFQRAGLRASYFPKEYLEPIEHGDDMRVLGLDVGGMGSKKNAIILSKIYRQIKLDVEEILLQKLDIDSRRQLMADVRNLLLKMLAQNIRLRSLDVALPAPANSPIIKKTITYQIEI